MSAPRAVGMKDSYTEVRTHVAILVTHLHIYKNIIRGGDGWVNR